MNPRTQTEQNITGFGCNNFKQNPIQLTASKLQLLYILHKYLFHHLCHVPLHKNTHTQNLFREVRVYKVFASSHISFHIIGLWFQPKNLPGDSLYHRSSDWLTLTPCSVATCLLSTSSDLFPTRIFWTFSGAYCRGLSCGYEGIFTDKQEEQKNKIKQIGGEREISNVKRMQKGENTGATALRKLDLD